jgi:branched-subunit amino acid transport protein AzlD
MLNTGQALYYSFVMGLVILLCRILPFMIFGRSADEEGGTKRRTFRFLSFVERVVPPVAMTVLAFNALAAPLKETPGQALALLPAAIFTALAHLWKRNALLSIVGGTALYMILRAVV